MKVTAGLGWGRYGSYGDIGSPFGARPTIVYAYGGKPEFGEWFRGPVALFAGVECKVNDRWTVKAEYSSDIYAEETTLRGTFDPTARSTLVPNISAGREPLAAPPARLVR